MGLGLFLKGSIPAGQDDWLQRASDWVAQVEDIDILSQLGRNHEDQPTLYWHIHPSAENVEISLTEPGRIVAAAKTSTTGPGYHIFLCDLLHRLGDELEVDWDDDGEGDETGYFHQGDREALEQEMLHWLGAMARFVGQHDASGFMIAMPLDHSYLGDGDEERILTQLGPRERDWFAAVAEDPRRGVDFFSWWEAELDARYYRDRALCEMWREVRWRPAILDEEAELLAEVADLLETAYDLDQAGLEFPWAEWHQILTCLGEHDTDPKLTELVAKRARQAGAPLIGYRRGSVKVNVVAGWSLDIPGSFAEEWDEEGKTWNAWEEGRSIWLSSFSMGAERSAEECLQLLQAPGDGERLDLGGSEQIGQATWGPGEKGDWQLQAVTATKGGAALLTIVVDDDADKDWAIRTWHSLRHAAPPEERKVEA